VNFLQIICSQPSKPPHDAATYLITSRFERLEPLSFATRWRFVGITFAYYIAFIRQPAQKPVLIIVPTVLLLPFGYESIVIVRYVLWLRRYV